MGDAGNLWVQDMYGDWVMSTLFGIPTVHEKNGAEAEMQCKRCRTVHWCNFDFRRSGKDNALPGHNEARCPKCPAGSDFTTWTGRARGKE